MIIPSLLKKVLSKRVFIILAAVLCLFIFKSISSNDQAITQFVVLEQLQVDLPETVEAGKPFSLTVFDIQPDKKIHISVESNYGKRKFVGSSTDGTFKTTIPGLDIPGTGQTLVQVVQGNSYSSSQLQMLPAATADPVDVYLGPRTVIADADHFVMQVAVPTDIFGNPIAEGTNVDFSVTRPELDVEEFQAPTQNLLAWIEIFSKTKSGRTRVATVVEDKHGAERDFLEVAGVPEKFTISLLDPLVPADGRALLRVSTGVLVDVFGNQMPDGISVTLDASGATGVRRLNGKTIDGVALFNLEAPSVPGEVTLIASASGVNSQALIIEFEPSVESFDYKIIDSEKTNQLIIGPVVSVNGSYIPDGTLVEIVLDDGTKLDQQALLGKAVFEFDKGVNLQGAEIVVLGKEVEVDGS